MGNDRIRTPSFDPENLIFESCERLNHTVVWDMLLALFGKRNDTEKRNATKILVLGYF